MQLFIIDFKKDGDHIIIENKDIAHQMRKVLRMKTDDLFFIQTQSTNYQDKVTRYQASIKNIETNTITGTITKTENHTPQNNIETTIAIAMPNKRSKAELITQKLSELGINKIYFRPSQRSIIKDSKDKKIDRLIKIAQEATEQSRGRTLPTVEFIKDISKLTENTNTQTIIFDKANQDKIIEGSTEKNKHSKIIGIIGPEGGLTENDYQKFGKNYTTQVIGESILRTETASIIAGWILKNH